MHLKITTTENMLAYEGDIQKISLPTEQGEKSLTETPLPMVIKLVPGLISYQNDSGTHTLSISKGIALIDTYGIRITSSMITQTPLKKLTELRSNQYLLELKLQKMKSEGNIEDISSLILELEKVKADIRLAQATY